MAAGAGILASIPGWGESSDVDVVIVGAGAAGIGAALALKKRNVSYRIFEGDTRVGGRALTDTQRLGEPFDIGCAWIHAAKPDNPFVQWADKLGFEIAPHDLALNQLYYRDTLYSSLAVDTAEKDEKYIAEAIERAASGLRDMKASEVVGDWREPMDAAALALGPMDAGVDLDELSTCDRAVLADYDPNYLVKDGYGALVKAVADKAGVTGDARMGTQVTEIRYDGKSVVVRTEGASAGTTRARAVIVTASMGALRHTPIKFTPSLPAPYMDAIFGLEMGLLAKIPLKIPGVSHYLNGIKPYDNVFDEEPRSGSVPRFDAKDIYFLAWPWNTDLMVGFVGGRFAWDLSTAADAEQQAIAFAKERLADIFGSDMPNKVTAALLTPWATNKWTHGAYSAAMPGHCRARQTLRRPLNDVVFFAGEATAEKGMYATCSGAYESGMNVAESVARTLRA
jgi:monoamine oxidase